MSITPVGGPTSAAGAQSAHVIASNQRAADGDYKTRGPGRASVKDTDGDYKALSTAQNTSSGAVQAAVTSLKMGG